MKINVETYQEDFLKIIYSYINKKSINTDGMDMLAIRNLARMHNLSPLVYHTVKDDLKDKEAKAVLEKDFLQGAIASANKEIEASHVINIFNKNKIKHIPIKGIVLRNMYDPPEIRLMGDVDIIVEVEKIGLVQQLLEADGYSYFCEHEDVYTFTKPPVELEIHIALLDSPTLHSDVYVDYLKNIWDNVHLVKDYTYEFDASFNFVYLLIHMLKHFEKYGCGIRLFLDMALYLKNYYVDFDYVMDTVSKLGMEKFYNLVFNICNSCFGTPLPKYCYDMNAEILNYFTDYVLNNGIFGHHGDRTELRHFRHKIKEKKSLKYYLCGLKLKVEMLLPPYKYLKYKSETLRKHPYLLPLFWIKRIFNRVHTKAVFCLCKLFEIDRYKDETKLQIQMFKYLDL